MPKQQENNISKMSENTKSENEKKEVEINGAIQKNKNRNLQISNSKFQL